MSRKMKSSNIEWIGLIPDEWNIRSIKSIIENIKSEKNSSYDTQVLSLSVNGVKVKKNLNEGMNPESYIGHQLVSEGDLVICLRDLDGPLLCGVSKYNGCLSNLYYVINFKDANSHFLDYLFHSMDYIGILDGFSYGMRHSYNISQFGSFQIALPDLEEQARIVRYLDEKISKIDESIMKTKKTIGEYKKYKSTIITETLIKGINKDTIMKDSGVDWIGLMPEHTKLIKIKYLFEIKKDIAGKEGYDILSVTQKGIKIKDISKNEGQIAQDYSKYQLVDKNDFVMNHMDLLTGWVDCSKYEGVTSPDYRVFRFINPEEHSKEYFTYLMQICYSNKIFYGLGQGVSNLGRWRLQTDKFLNFKVPVPTLNEQQEIVEYLDEKCIEIDKLIDKKEQLIIELENYKKSLIYECVTGKKEI